MSKKFTSVLVEVPRHMACTYLVNQRVGIGVDELAVVLVQTFEIVIMRLVNVQLSQLQHSKADVERTVDLNRGLVHIDHSQVLIEKSAADDIAAC